MSKQRKTVPVAEILRTANYFLKYSADEQRDERRGVANLLESVLHLADAYKGYNYLPSAGVDHESATITIVDDSRRFYYPVQWDWTTSQ